MDCSRRARRSRLDVRPFAPHFHLPLQHASERVLAAMRRPYTIDYYASLVSDIRARIPHASIGTDVIVDSRARPTTTSRSSRPTSSDRRSPTSTYFPYSDRPGTPASTMGGRAAGTVIRERARRAREIGARLSDRFRASQVGTTHRALTLEDGSVVVTGNYLKLRIPAGSARNEWVTVMVTAHDTGDVMLAAQ